MKILKLRPEDKEWFEWLDPFGFLERLKLPHYFAFVACLGKEDYDLPAGLLIGSKTHDQITIEWLCVGHEYRGNEIGGELLTFLFERADEIGIKKIGVRFVSRDDMEDVEKNAKEYFEDFSFLNMEELPGEWNIPLSKLLSDPFFKSDREDLPRSFALSEIDEEEFGKMFGNFQGDDKGFRLYDIFKAPLQYDRDVSSVIIENGEIRGLFLMERINSTCYPIFLYAESAKEEEALITCAAKGAERTMPEDGNIYLIANDKIVGERIVKRFPDEHIKSRRLAAEVDS